MGVLQLLCRMISRGEFGNTVPGQDPVSYNLLSIIRYYKLLHATEIVAFDWLSANLSYKF